MNRNSNHKFSDGERNIFKSIAGHVQANPNYYKEAGEWLDEYCSESTYWLRQDNKLEELEKKHTQFPVLAHQKTIANLKNRIKERRTPALLKRFQEARKYLLDKYGDENFVSKEIAAKVIIITWLLTDPDAEKRKVGITELETWPWEPIDDVSKMTRSFAGLLFAQNKDAWMRLVRIGWDGITTSGTKAAPKDKVESTKTEHENKDAKNEGEGSFIDNTKPTLKKVLSKNFIKATIKHFPYCGSYLFDIIYGVDGMKEQKEKTDLSIIARDNIDRTVPEPKKIVNELDNGSQSARATAIRSAAAELEQIANNFENWAKKHHAKYVDPAGVKPPAFTLAQIEDWVNTYLLKQRLVAVFFSHPHLSYDKNFGLTPFLTTYERKEFHLIIDVFRLHMPAIATSLKELYDEFWKDVRYHIECHERSKKVQQENIPSIGESIENTFWHPPLFLDGTVLSTVKRLRHIAKIAKGNLATSVPAETVQDTKREREGMIQAKPPETLAKMLWLKQHGKKHWKLISITILVILIPSLFVLPKIELFSKKPNVTANSNIFADVSKDGTILRNKGFDWKISKSKDKEDNVVYLINGIEGYSTAISVFPDNSTKKYYVRNAIDGIVIVFTCPEEEVSNFTIKVKN